MFWWEVVEQIIVFDGGVEEGVLFVWVEDDSICRIFFFYFYYC